MKAAKNICPTFRDDPAAALEYFRENGYQLEPDLFSAQYCDQLIAASKQIPTYLDKTYTPYIQPHKIDPIYLKAMSHPPLLRIMEKLVAGHVYGLQTKYFFCQPGTTGFVLHQDNFYVQAPRDAFASAWLALQDTTMEMGGLTMYPGSHREELLPIEKVDKASFGQDPNGAKLQAIVPPQYKPVSFFIPKGSVVFIHGFVVHGSGDNQTDKFRQSFLMTYIRQGETFRSGAYAQREPLDVYAA